MINVRMVLVAFVCLFFWNERVFAENLCMPKGTAAYFFNGVNNHAEDAISSAVYMQYSLRETLGDDYLSKKKVEFGFFYNGTSGVMKDLMEFLNQRGLEVGISSYDFLVAIRNGNNKRVGVIAEKYPHVADMVEPVVKFMNEVIVDKLIELIDNNGTQESYKKLKKHLMEDVADDKRFILFAHSQGNMFLNEAYKDLLSTVDKSDIRVLHIAPPSRFVNGDYVLSKNDIVIALFKNIEKFGSVPDENIEIPFNVNDFSGHGFVETYMNRDFIGAPLIISKMHKNIFDLDPERFDNGKNNAGFFRISIKTPMSDGIVLFVSEPENANPNNNYRYFKEGDSVGYKSSCDSNNLVGSYTVRYANYNDGDGFSAQLVLSDYRGRVLFSKDINIEPYEKQTGYHPIVDIGRVFVDVGDDGKLVATFK